MTGKTPLAVREGAYTLLEKLGFRWFFKSPIWNVVPDSLTDLSGLNDVEDPSYIWRLVNTEGIVGTNESEDWNRHNLMFGAHNYETYHSYAGILDKAGYGHDQATYNAHPEWFLPTGGYDNYPWQLNPTNPDVIAMAEQYARTSLGYGPSGLIVGDGDVRESRVVPISPNDGGGFNPPYSNYQDVTNAVFGLANTVAQNISSDYPNDLVGLYVYAQYSQIPSFALEPNILAYVATSYNYGNLSIYQQIQGLQAKGIQVGIRDYVDIWQWYNDDWSSSMTIPEQVQFYNSLGVKYYNGEAIDNWGGRGLIYYTLSKILWNTNLDVNNVLDDFYTKAFGPAAATMKEYYEVRSDSDDHLAESFRLLDQAESEAAGDQAVLQRIRFLECYNYFMWKWHNVGLTNLSNTDLEEFYTFLTRTRDWYVVSYKNDEPAVHDELSSRGYSSAQITTLQNFTVPSAEYVSGLMDEALAVWGNVPGPVVSPTPNPLKLDLTSLGDNSTPTDPLTIGRWGTVLVDVITPGNVTINVKGHGVTLHWYNPTGFLLGTYDNTNIDNWTSTDFNAPNAGLYVLTADWGSNTETLQIDVPGRPAGLLAAKGYTIYGANHTDQANFEEGTSNTFFYVPNGTDAFTFVTTVCNASRPVHGTLLDPDGNSTAFNDTAGTEHDFTNPIPGLWKLNISVSSDSTDTFYLTDILPLVWHNPQYLLVPGQGFAPPAGNNHAPTDISLSNSSMAENQPAGTTVGNFSTTDPDAGDTHTYTLVTGTGKVDNASFDIVGNQLRTKASFDYETKNSYSIRVRSTDKAPAPSTSKNNSPSR